MANKIYQVSETPLVWADTGSSHDELLTCTSLANLAGRQGAMHDFGTSARCQDFIWRFTCKLSGTPTIGNSVEVWWKTSDGTYPDNTDGTSDAALSSVDKLRNLLFLGVLIGDDTSVVQLAASGGPIALPHRYGAPVIFNRAIAFSSTAADHKFILTPVVLEVQ